VSAPALELIDLHAGYGRIEVLRGVSLVVPSGSVFALLGPNGAGKTTTLKVVDGRVPVTGGCVHIAGTHLNGASTDDLARAGVCGIPEGRGIFPNLTVAENIKMMTYADKRLRASDLEAVAFARFPILGQRRKQLVGTMSGGQQQMVAIARAIVTDPSLLLVDELSMGLAPLIVEELYGVLGQLAADGISILLVEQFARTALRIADYAAVLSQGRIVAMGEPADLAEAISSTYLGASA
jgi:branched-chain amino acid transport system ATP-binding protein